jgi:hypothetical protein
MGCAIATFLLSGSQVLLEVVDFPLWPQRVKPLRPWSRSNAPPGCKLARWLAEYATEFEYWRPGENSKSDEFASALKGLHGCLSC